MSRTRIASAGVSSRLGRARDRRRRSRSRLRAGGSRRHGLRSCGV